MSAIELVIVFAVFYSISCVLAGLVSDGQLDADEIILWPLVFVKFLLKGLYKILFTGWRI